MLVPLMAAWFFAVLGFLVGFLFGAWAMYKDMAASKLQGSDD